MFIRQVLIDFLQLGVDYVIIVRFVREGAIRATLDFFHATRIFKISPAMVAPKIERTIAKQAIESIGIATLMARKVSAIDILEKFVAVVHTSSFYKNFVFQEYPDMFPENPVYN